MSKKLFLTGTDTDIGKTFVAGLLVKKLKESGVRAAYYKAAMSGNDRGPDGRFVPGDALFVKEISGITQPLDEMCPYIYGVAVSPHLAARMEGNPVEMARVLQTFWAVCENYDYVTIEGSGGILCPIRLDQEKIMLTDIIKACDASCLIVADAGLGTINHVGLTAHYMKTQEIPIKGIILNHFEPGNLLHEDNLKQCEWLTGVKVVACVRDGDTDLRMPSEQLLSLYT